MGKFTRRIWLILVILSIFVIVDGHRRKRRHCPSRDDEDNVCCEWKTKSYLHTVHKCQKCYQPTDKNPKCGYRRRANQYFCWFTYTINVTNVECEAKCCDGWVMDADGDCSVQASDVDSSQQIVCENGGSPAGDHCTCKPGFMGTNCETPVCSPPCLNNGVCSPDDDKAVCICPEDRFKGIQCEIPVCKQPCQNGGTCMADEYDSKCVCAPGYYGETCAQEIKDGDCPDVSGIGLCYTDCSYDMDCSGTKKCCPNACGGNVCTYPANSTCTYNGQQYPVGHVTNKSPCSTCFCKHPDKPENSQWECFDALMSCPTLSCPHTKSLPGLCCPVCEDIPTTVPVPSTTAPPPTTSRRASTCEENGVQYQLGQVINRNNFCERCTCGITGDYADWMCMVIDCFWNPECSKWNYIKDQCCPVCEEMTTRTTIPTTKPTSSPTQTCKDNGIEYPIGATRSLNNNCGTCHCIVNPYQIVEWNCRHVDCPNLGICEMKYIQGQCCPVCEDSTPAPTKAPSTSPTTKTTMVPLCYLNGVGYPHLSVVQKTDCDTCTCRYSYGGYMTWDCFHQTCLELTCQNPKKLTGKCCPVCDAPITAKPVSTTQRPESAPAFRHCPNGILTLHTNHENFVDIRKQLNLEVVDSAGRTFKVKYTKEIIYAKACNCSDNYHLIAAQSEVDQFGRFATCIFTVHIFDNHPPVYNICPSSVDGFDDETISWDKPEAVDNVAVSSEKLQSMFENNSKFKVGSHVVVYVATDHQGNIGICNFLVRIYKRESTNTESQNEEGKEKEKDRNLMINAVIGALAALILLTILAILMMCYRRQKSRTLARANDTETRGYDNAIYDTPHTPPPSYGSSDGLKMKLPPKYIIGDEKPPVYEEIDVHRLAKKAIINPVYESNGELHVTHAKPQRDDDTYA